MKSDKEFIAGIYQKAEEQLRKEKEEEIKKHPAHGWRWLPAAACVFLLAGTAFIYGRRGDNAEDNKVEPTNYIEPLSADIETGNIPKIRTVGMEETVYGTVAEYRKPGETVGILVLDVEGKDRVTVSLDFDAGLETGDEVIVLLPVGKKDFFLQDANELYIKKDDGLFYNAGGSIFSEGNTE